MPPLPEVNESSQSLSEDEYEAYEVETDDHYDPGDDIADLDFEEVNDNADDEENGYIPDDSVMVFTEHKGSVFSVCFNPSNDKMVISGGEDDKAHIWFTEGDGKPFECSGHKDSVISCGFSFDGKYASSVDMSGIINVWTTEDFKNAWQYECCSDIEWARWHPLVPVLLIGTDTGEVYMFKIPSGDCKVYQSHGSKTVTGAFLSDGKHAVVGYEDGSLKMWDLKASTVVFGTEEGLSPVNCLAVSKSGVAIAAGFVDGKTKVFNNQGKLLCTLVAQTTADKDEEISIESLSFSPDQLFLASGSLNGKLTIWDVSSARVRNASQAMDGITVVTWLPLEPNNILTCGLEGVVRLWDWKSCDLLKEFFGHRDAILAMSVNSAGDTILTGSDDKSVHVFKLSANVAS